MNRRDMETLSPLAWLGLVPLRSVTTAVWAFSRAPYCRWRGSHDGARTVVSYRQAQGEQPMRAFHHFMLAWGAYDILQFLMLSIIIYLLVRNGG